MQIDVNVHYPVISKNASFIFKTKPAYTQDFEFLKNRLISFEDSIFDGNKDNWIEEREINKDFAKNFIILDDIERKGILQAMFSSAKEKLRYRIIELYKNVRDDGSDSVKKWKKTCIDAMPFLAKEDINLDRINFAKKILNNKETGFLREDFHALQYFYKIKKQYDDMKDFLAKNNIPFDNKYKIDILEDSSFSYSKMEEAIFNASVYIIKFMPSTEETETKSLVLNILKFMNQTLKGNEWDGRDKCALSGKQILAGGNFCGCGEAARCFFELLKKIDPKTDCNFIHSFKKEWALRLAHVQGEPGRPNFKNLKTEEKKIKATQDWIEKTNTWLMKTGVDTEEKKNLNKSICSVGGHTVIEVYEKETWDKGEDSIFIVNTSNFQETGVQKIEEEETMQVKINGRKGAVRQIKSEDLDLRIVKINGEFYVLHYNYRCIDKKECRKKFKASTIEEVNDYIQNFAYKDKSFKNLKPSLIKKEESSTKREGDNSNGTSSKPGYGVFKCGEDECIIYAKSAYRFYTDEKRMRTDHVRKALEWLNDPDNYKANIYMKKQKDLQSRIGYNSFIAILLLIIFLSGGVMGNSINNNIYDFPQTFKQFDKNNDSKIGKNEVTEDFTERFTVVNKKDREAILSKMIYEAKSKLIWSLIKLKKTSILTNPAIISNMDKKQKEEMLNSLINLYLCAGDFRSKKPQADAMMVLFKEDISKISPDYILNKTSFMNEDFLNLIYLLKMKIYYDDIKSFYGKNNIKIDKITELEKINIPDIENKIFDSAVSIIKQMPNEGEDKTKGQVLNVLKFMNKNINHRGRGRDACEWSAKKILASASTNGCVENAKVFQALFKAVNPGIETKYVSSFKKDWALRYKKIGDNPEKPEKASQKTEEEYKKELGIWIGKMRAWTRKAAEWYGNAEGHAVIEVNDSQKGKFIVDTSSFYWMDREIKEEETIRSEKKQAG
ncbi:MAG: hypothetical protein ABIH00_05805 [Armatimonadota bacterium]